MTGRKGRGFSEVEDREGWHGKPLPEHMAERAVVELGGELPRGTLPSVARSGKPVTNQVTTAPADTGPGQCQSDRLKALTCTDQTQRDLSRRDERPW